MLVNDIADSLMEIRRSEDGLIEATFVFDESLSFFKGHFPQNPLVPGILQIEIVRHVAQVSLRAPLTITEVARAKFAAPLKPAEHLHLTLRLTGEGDEFTAAGKLTVDGRMVSSINLSLHKEEVSA